ncbi:MAG: carbohydrate binding domain-containing protein [Bacteroidota bacterium]
MKRNCYFCSGVFGVMAMLALLAALTLTASAQNLIRNPGFESGPSPWVFYTNGTATFQTDGVGDNSLHSAHITVVQPGSNTQLYQSGIRLEPNTWYTLSLKTKPPSGYNWFTAPFTISLLKHGAPFTIYGVAQKKAHFPGASEDFQWFDLEFKTSGFSTVVTDARLRLAFNKSAEVLIDDITLTKGAGIIKNGDFWPELSPWIFSTNGVGQTQISNFVNYGVKLDLTIDQPGSTMQLYQSGISLEPNTIYKLTFCVEGSTNMSVSLFRHDAPYTNYGLNNVLIDIIGNPSQCGGGEIVFRTKNFATRVANARLRFWFVPYAHAGDWYEFYGVQLAKVVTKGSDEQVLIPDALALQQNYPNPFNPTTVISYDLPVALQVSLRVYDLLGKEVATLVDGIQDAGFKSVEFDASTLASGVYFYRLQTGEFISVKKMIVTK